MRAAGHRLRLGLLALTLSAPICSCAPGPALDGLREQVLFYAWTHGSALSDRPEEVAKITDLQIRSLREIEDFAGGLDEWRRRTSPVERIRVGPEDLALGSNLYFYYLASLRRPAVAAVLRLEITRTGPDGSEAKDLVTQGTAQINRRAQSGGVLYSMAGLPAGEHRLRLDVVDGDDLAASGDLWVDYRPEVVTEG